MKNHKSATGISVIIPAYNEAENIGAVLAVVQRWKGAREIIVVNDGSTDQTAQVVKEWQGKDGRIKLYTLTVNQGKGNAMYFGVKQATAPFLLFLDADLQGLCLRHLQQLIAPVKTGLADMTVARFENGRFQTTLMHHVFPFLSGQRGMKVSTFLALFDTQNKDWSIETALNLHAWWQGYQTQYIPWNGVTHKMRPEKRVGLSGYLSHAQMWWQIGTYTANFLLRQLYWTVVKSQLQERASKKLASKIMPKQSR